MNRGTLAEMRGVITPQRVADAVSTALVGPISLHNAVVATLAKRINGKGFDAKPGGFRFGSGEFFDAGASANFWSSSQVGSSAWLRSLGAENDQVFRQGNTQQLGLSVRCIKDTE